MKNSWGMYKVIFVLFLKKTKKNPKKQTTRFLSSGYGQKCIPILPIPKFSDPWRQITLEEHWITVFIFFNVEIHWWYIENTEEHTFIFIDHEPGIYMYHIPSKAWEDYSGGQTDIWITADCLGFFFLKKVRCYFLKKFRRYWP